MPKVKLTLRLDADLVERGKAYAKTHDTSLSRILEDNLRVALRSEARTDGDEDYLPPNEWGVRVHRSFIIESAGPNPELSDEEARQLRYEEYSALE